MKPELKSLIIEFIILIAIFTATWLAAFWLTGRHHILHPALEIELHDTYFVLSWKTIVAEPFLMFVTIIYLVKESFHGYKRRIQNLILIVSDFLFIIQLSKFFSLAGMLEVNQQWTVYPSLPELQNEKTPVEYNHEILLVEHGMFITLIIFLLILIASAILTGKNWKTEHYETEV